MRRRLELDVDIPGMLKHLNIRVYGRVVGVGFRWEAKKRADELRLTGFVRNEPDESIYIEAEGEREREEKFLAWCEKGPPFAEVEKVEFTESPPKGYADFKILP